MIELVNAYIGTPSSQPAVLALKDRSLLLYPTADSVVVLDARTLALVRILAFSDIFPATLHGTSSITAVAIDPAMKLVLASMDNYLAAWSLSGVQQDTWRIHSSLTLPKDVRISAIDCRSGLLALACSGSLSVYSLVLENDLLTWSKKWASRAPNPTTIHFSPSLQYMATVTQPDSLVRIYLTTSGRPAQIIPHPRPVVNVNWRQPQPDGRDDMVLYTVTQDATLRVFMPVLDAPQHLQLHATFDMHSASHHLPSRSLTGKLSSSVFWLDRLAVADSLQGALRNSSHAEDGKTRRARDILEEGWDLFLRVFSDGSLVVKALANVNSRPPTLLKQFTLLQTPFPAASLPDYLALVPNTKQRGGLTLVTSPPITSFALSPLEFFDARDEGLVQSALSVSDVQFSGSHITRFVRTPEGHGVAVLREQGGEAWRLRERGTRLEKTAVYDSADQVIVLDHGRILATYSSEHGMLTLHSDPPCTIDVPEIVSLFTEPASSPGGHTCIYALTTAPTSILHIHAVLFPSPSLILQSQTQLPLDKPPAHIVRVDPMGWSRGSIGEGVVHDVLLSVGENGELGFWVPDEESGFGDDVASRRRTGWKRTGSVRTGRTGITKAACSSAKKTVLVVSTPEGEEITIWDSKESQFASGLEYAVTLDASDRVNDLDWSSTPDTQSILAVGYARRIDILCQQRATYFEDDPGWAVVKQISLEGVLPHPISDSIWLANGSLLVGAGHQMLLYGQAHKEKSTEDESLFEHVARRNGPLVDYHPQMLLQCLLWEKLELVKQIICNLARDVERFREWERLPELQDGPFEWTSVGIEAMLQRTSGGEGAAAFKSTQGRQQRDFLSDAVESYAEPEDTGFSRLLVEKLLEHLEEHPLPHLTPNEHAHLLVLVQTTLEVDESRRALDANGLRYLISMRSFYILNARATSPASPEPRESGVIARRGGWRERLRYRDIVWAYHSESQGLLMASASSACENKMTWSDARALGVFMWSKSLDDMKAQMEVVARNEYMAGDARDPVACSLFYFVVGKHKLVHGLWRQASWHREQQPMLKFLGNDFTQARWRTAANKNAYALLSKRRFEYAAAFFLLGGSLRDAVQVCLRNLDDFQLAVALARIHEGGDDGPILNMVLTTKVIPEAFRTGNRYLGSWAFWLLHRRDLAVRILVTPLQDIASTLNPLILDIGSPHYDDPSLALLFSQLKAKTLQAAQGTSEISGRVEFSFVLQIARVFVRMGCHALALDLVRSWSFDRPSTVTRDATRPTMPTSPMASRFALEPALRRRSSIMIDMDVETAPPTRRPSPTRELSPVREATPTVEQEDPKPQQPESDLVQRKAGIGSLMKAAKQNVQVAEFDMGAFGF